MFYSWEHLLNINYVEDSTELPWEVVESSWGYAWSVLYMICKKENECMNILLYTFCGYQALIPHHFVLNSSDTMKMICEKLLFMLCRQTGFSEDSCFWKKSHFKLTLDHDDPENAPRLVNQMHCCKQTFL